MPMSGVRSQELPLHGELSTRSLAPAASTAGWLASMASAGSLTPLGRYAVWGLPTEPLLSADTALASVGRVRAAVRDNSATRMPTRRAIVGLPPLVGTSGSIPFATGKAQSFFSAQSESAPRQRTGPPPSGGGGPVTYRYGLTRLMRVAQLAREVRVLPQAPIGAVSHWVRVPVWAVSSEGIQMLLPSTAVAP